MALRLRHSGQDKTTITALYALTLLNVVDTAAMRSAKRKTRHRSKQTVLFAKMDGIGDMVLWSTFFPAIDKLYPPDAYRRVLVGDTRWEGLLARESPFDETVFVSNRRFAIDPVYRFRVLRKVRSIGADIAINCRLTRCFVWEDAIIRVSGAAVRAGSGGINNLMTAFQSRLSNRWYTRLIPAPAERLHELDAHANFLAGVTGEPVLSPVIHPKKVNVDGPIIFVLGSADPGKSWPPEKIAETIEAVMSRYERPVILCGGPEQKNVTAGIIAKLSRPPQDMVGRTTLKELRDILTSAAMVVSGDTGAAHISTLGGVPTVVLSPGNHLGRFFPYPEHIQRANGLVQRSVIHRMPCFGCGWHCTWTDVPDDAPKPCISGISPADVIEVMEALMSSAIRAKIGTAAMLS